MRIISHVKFKSMLKIKEGEPQPVPCKKCNAKHGYKISQKIATNRDNIYAESGADNGCVYGEMEKVTHTYKTIGCANCNSPLPFQISA